MRISHCGTLQDNSQIAAMAETVAYNVIVYVAKATTQPATETDILKHACDFIIYKLERREQSLCGGLETSILILPLLTFEK